MLWPSLQPKFGLDVIRIDLKPAEDPLIDRMKALTNLPIRFDEDIEFERVVKARPR